MTKIISPQQYGPILDELNRIRPLKLTDTVRPSIDIGVCNALASSDKKSLLGRFVRGTHQGSVLVKNIKELTQYELIQINQLSSTAVIDIEFAQRVFRVVVNYKEDATTNNFCWCVPVNHVEIQPMYTEGIYQLNFVGTMMSFYGDGIPIGNTIFDVYGFF